MDSTHYQHIKYYLINQKVLETWTTKEQQSIKRKSQYYILKNNLLYRYDKQNQNNLLKVIQQHEVELILFMMHNHPLGGHFRTEAMFNKIRNIYYWPQMYEHIRLYVQSCDNC